MFKDITRSEHTWKEVVLAATEGCHLCKLFVLKWRALVSSAARQFRIYGGFGGPVEYHRVD